MRKRTIGAALLALALSACGTGAGAGGGTTLSLVGFAVPKAANNAIQREWAKTADGEGVVWEESYGASGDQSRAVAGGLKADYVHFSLEGDVTRLVEAGLVAPEWNAGPSKGVVSTSVVVIAVRKGNPKGIAGWDDLTKPGIGIVTPNPGSSGSARWNILSAYGHAEATNQDPQAFITTFFANVVALPGSGRDATTAFTGGTGDVLLTYENEAILARQNGEDFDYIVPDTTLLIENPGAVLKGANPKAAQWLEFALSATGQTEYAKVGFRPLVEGIDVEVPGANDPANPYPTPRKLQTITDDFGGWPAANKKFFGDDGIITKVQKEISGS